MTHHKPFRTSLPQRAQSPFENCSLPVPVCLYLQKTEVKYCNEVHHLKLFCYLFTCFSRIFFDFYPTSISTRLKPKQQYNCEKISSGHQNIIHTSSWHIHQVILNAYSAAYSKHKSPSAALEREQMDVLRYFCSTEEKNGKLFREKCHKVLHSPGCLLSSFLSMGSAFLLGLAGFFYPVRSSHNNILKWKNLLHAHAFPSCHISCNQNHVCLPAEMQRTFWSQLQKKPWLYMG